MLDQIPVFDSEIALSKYFVQIRINKCKAVKKIKVRKCRLILEMQSLSDNPWPIIFDTDGVEDRARFSEFGTLQTQQGQSKFADGKTILQNRAHSFSVFGIDGMGSFRKGGSGTLD